MGSVWRRLVNATNAALVAAVQAWNERAQTPGQPDWDSYSGRLSRYALYQAYHDNTVYNSLLTSAKAHREARKLYQHIRSIYNPVSRQVALIASMVYGGSINMQTLKTGAIPLVYDNDELTPAIQALWKWSRWQENKTLYPRIGALMGDVALKVVDEPAKGRVRIEVLNPAKIEQVKTDAVGNIVEISIAYYRSEPDLNGGRRFLYRERIDKQWFRTEMDSQPFAFYADGDGQPMDTWPNEYGFVPVALAKHYDVGQMWGANAFYNALPKVDELNDLASLLNDQIRKTVTPIWALEGAAGQKLDLPNDARDSMPLLRLPTGARMTPLVAPLSLGDALGSIEKVYAEIEKDMPELALTRIREAGNLTAPGVRTGYSDAISRIEESRGNYDGALVRAVQMAVSVGGMRGYAGFQGFTLDSYDAGDMEMAVKERPVIADTLATTERIQAIQTASALPPAYARLVLSELDVDDDTIDDILAEQQPPTPTLPTSLTENAFQELADLYAQSDNAPPPEVP